MTLPNDSNAIRDENGRHWAGPVAVPRRPLRILLDARKVGDGGIGTYIENLAKGLLSSGQVELSVVARPGGDRRDEWWSRVEVIEDSAKPYSVDEYLFFGRRLPQSRFDLFHSPHFTLPFGMSLPSVITVHDLIHIRSPERAYYPLVAAPLIRSAVRRARRVIAVSEATAADLRSLVRGNRTIVDKLSVVPNAFDPALLGCRMEPQEALRTLHLTKPYFLAVLSSVKPHKGVQDLLAAFERVQDWASRQGRPISDIRLVLAGQGTQHLVERDPLFERVTHNGGIHVVGTVSKSLLGGLYGGALRVIVPSTAEGFCFPVLESHLFGTSVICRPIPAVRELVSASDVVAKDFSVEALVECMQAVLLRWRQGEESRFTGSVDPFCLPCVTEKVLAVYRSAVANSDAAHSPAPAGDPSAGGAEDESPGSSSARLLTRVH